MEGDGVRFAGALASRCGGSVTAYAQFGTATVLLPSGVRVDVASARAERYPFPGALPVVRPASLEEDLLRRDFTVHATAIVFAPPRVCDPAGGIQDLKKRLVRILHPRSFEDDPTRLVRAVRYGVRLGFRYDRSTARQLRRGIREGYLSRVSAGRLRDELALIEKEPLAFRMVRALEALGMLGELEALNVNPQAGRLRGWLDAAGMAIERLGKPRMSPSQIVEALHALPLPVVRGLAELPAAGGRSLAARRVGSRVRAYLARWSAVRPRLTGKDLKAWGIPPGPRFRELLEALRVAVLDGKVKDTAKAQAAYLKRLLDP